jgi:hypothetical protein
MRILYVAAGIPMPGSIGGSTHVIEVSRGLAALGHEVLVVAGANAEGARSEPWALPGTEGRALVCNVPRRQALALTLLPAILRLCA